LEGRGERSIKINIEFKLPNTLEVFNNQLQVYLERKYRCCIFNAKWNFHGRIVAMWAKYFTEYNLFGVSVNVKTRSSIG
jgi:hypothetical protein